MSEMRSVHAGPSASPAVARVTRYAPPRSCAPVDLHLDANEGATPPADCLDVLHSLESDALRRYPDTSALEALLARRWGVDPGRVIVTAGADEAIDRLCRAVLAPGREIVVPEPTFEMLTRYVGLAGGEQVRVPWHSPRYPTADVLREVSPNTALIAVVSPNNPTGAVATAEDLRVLSAGAPHALLLVDLAYAEFADEDPTAAALALPNAVVARTLSKAWGLAGLRVGYAIGPAEVIGWMRTAGGPYPVSSLALAVAAGRLQSRDTRELPDFVARIRHERDELARLLAHLGARPRPSQANFVLADFGEQAPSVRDAFWVRDALAGLGIGVRAFDEPELASSLRITCPGEEAGFARLAAALRCVLAPQALLFDLDGVLADVSASYRSAIHATAESLGVRLEPGEISAAKARGAANNDWQLTQRLLAEHGVDADLDAVTERFERLYQGTLDAPGLRRHERLLISPDLVSRLAARYPLAVVTGRPRPDAVRFLRESGIEPCMRALVCMEDAPIKPDPAPVRLALRRLGVDRAWLVGDTPDDIRAARTAGVVPIGIVPPGEDASRLGPALSAAGAARVLTEMQELEVLLP